MKWWDQGLSKSPKDGCFRKWQVNLWRIFVLIPSSVSPASSFAQVTVRHFPAMCKPRKIHLRSRTIRWNHEQLLERNTQSFFWSVRKVLRSCEVSLTSKWGLLMRGLLQLGCFWKLLKLSFSSRNLQILWIRIEEQLLRSNHTISVLLGCLGQLVQSIGGPRRMRYRWPAIPSSWRHPVSTPLNYVPCRQELDDIPRLGDGQSISTAIFTPISTHESYLLTMALI